MDSARLLHAMRRVHIASWSTDCACALGAFQSSQTYFAKGETPTSGTFPSAELPRDDIVASLLLITSPLSQVGLPVFCLVLWWSSLQGPRAGKGDVPEDLLVGLRVVRVLILLHIVAAVHHGSGESLRPLVRQVVSLPSPAVGFILDGISAPVGFYLDGIQLASVVFLPLSDLPP